MKLEFISNTGFYLEHQGTVLGMDIWLTQGAFEGSWFHFPPLRETLYSVEKCKYIYISHIHPDHCDFNAIKRASPEATFIVPNYFNHLLAKKLRSFGFKNIVSLAPNESVLFDQDQLKITLYGQFCNNLFHEAALGSLIDSSILIEWDNRLILNCNDNYLNEDWARKFGQMEKRIDLALLPHSASGPYPASFRNLTPSEKEQEAQRLQNQYIDHFLQMIQYLNPKIAVPCAAEYAIVGEQYLKNPYIGLAESSAAVIAAQKNPKTQTIKVFQLDCGTILNIDRVKLEGLPVRQADLQDKLAFATQHKTVPYPYHWEDQFYPVDFDQLVREARKNLFEKQKKLNYFINYNINLVIDEIPQWSFNFSSPDIVSLQGKKTIQEEPFLDCYLGKQLFYQILVKKAHWNNAEGGLHIDFFRKPNRYVPEIFTLMSFFHISESHGHYSIR